MTSGNISLLNRAEAARYLGVSVGTLAVWTSTRRYRLPTIKVGRLVRYSQADLDQWLVSRRQLHPGDRPDVDKKSGA